MAVRGWKIFASVLLVWVVTVTGVITGTVPPAEAAIAAPVDVTPSAVASVARGGQVEALAMARFGRAAGSSASGAALGGPAEVAPTGVPSLAVSAIAGVVGDDDLIDIQTDPTEFDEIEQQLLDRLKEASIETVKKPGFDVWPGFEQLQLVGLNTWFRVDDEAWQEVTVEQKLSFETMTAVGNPLKVEYEFDNGDSKEIRFCRQQGIGYSESADRSQVCSRGWDHTSAVEPQSVRARLVYEFQWELLEQIDGDDEFSGTSQITATGDYQIVGEWSDVRELTIGEIGTVATDGTSPPQVRPDRGEAVETLEVVPVDQGCGFLHVLCYAGQIGVAIWRWAGEQWDTLSSGLIGVANALYSVGKGCFSNIVDVFIGLKDMITKVAAFVDNPVAFIQEQITLAQDTIAALTADPLGMIALMASAAVEQELWERDKPAWIGKFGCQLVAALFTGGSTLITRFRTIDNMYDAIDSVLGRR